MDSDCAECGRNPGSGYRCRHCGATQYRYAIDSDDWEGSHPESEEEDSFDQESWEAGGSDDTEAALEAELEELLRPTPKAPPDKPIGRVFRTHEPVASEPLAQPQGGGRRGCFVVFLIIALGFAVLGTLFGFLFSEEDGTGPVEITGTAGECLLLESDGAVVTETSTVDCDEPHDAEVFWTGTFAEGPFPGDAALSSDADDKCYDAFEPYVGTSYADSIYFYDWLVPTGASWGAGDRELLCTIVSGDGSRLVGSAFASGR